MEVLLASTARAAIISATHDQDGTQAVAALPSLLEGPDSPVRGQAIAVREAMEGFVAAAPGIIATYSEAGRIPQLRSLVSRTLAPRVQALAAAGLAEDQAQEAAWLRLVAVPAGDATTAMLRQQDRTTFAPLDITAASAWIESADVEQLGALVEAGQARFPKHLPGQLWERLERRYALQHFLRMSGRAADFARRPTADEPLARGVDWVAAERDAELAFARHEQRAELVEAVEQAVRGIVTVIAFTCSLSIADAFDLLMGKVPA